MTAGDALADEGRHGEALASFNAAWQALDEPKDEQDWAVNVLAAIADCCFFLGRWDECRDAIQHAFRCGADVSNPFLRLRLGQCLYELGNLRESTDWLVPVYLMEGREPFKDEDPKYLESFRSQLKPPPEGWPAGW
jgi:tetratricopeptide (TPR) repeat protein